MPDITVIIVNWNSKEFVLKCLSVLMQQPSAADLEIIVVDNASFDGCEEALKEKFPHVIYHQLKQNVGFGRANNAGFKLSTSDVIWFLNPDTEVIDDAGTRLLSVLRQQQKAGLVGARLLNSDGTLQTSCVQSLPTVFNQTLDSEALRRHFGIWGMTAFRSESAPIEVEAVSGACMMIRRSDFESIGGFDPIYFMYCEDMDLCFGLRKRGLSIIYVPDAVVIHHGGRSSERQISRFSVVMTREALVAYFSKNFGRLSAGIYRLLIGVSAIIRILLLSFGKLFRWRNPGQDVGSLRKWAAVLSWCVGRERWVKTYSTV